MQHVLANAVRNGFRSTADEKGTPTILVVGDLMLDRYLWGNVERISPEAPVPIVHLTRETKRLGGAGNVAANVAGLGVKAILAGYIGEDADGLDLRKMLVEAGISGDGVVSSQTLPTIVKTRIIGGHQQILRLDREQAGSHTTNERQQLLDKILTLLDTQAPQAVILSDYAKGVLDNETCRTIISAARKRQIPVFVDPKGRDYGKYHGATALTPNKKEAAEACQVMPQSTEGLLESAAQLRVELGLAFMVITRGEEGISLVSTSGIEHLPATARQVFDVSGAGDTVISVLAASFVAGLEPKPACHLANLAAGIVVGKVGTASVYREELLRALELEEATKQANKICRLDELLVRLQAWRALEQPIVFTNGCFDLLHVGHVTYLEQARKLGGRLIVGLNTDRSIRALKGSTRPIINENDRAHVLAALEAVDAVILFDEDTPLNLINAIHPDILVKGSDYREDQVVGGSVVKSWGGKVELVQLVPYQSTSSIIARINN